MGPQIRNTETFSDTDRGTNPYRLSNRARFTFNFSFSFLRCFPGLSPFFLYIFFLFSLFFSLALLFPAIGPYFRSTHSSFSLRFFFTLVSSPLNPGDRDFAELLVVPFIREHNLFCRYPPSLVQGSTHPPTFFRLSISLFAHSLPLFSFTLSPPSLFLLLPLAPLARGSS